MIKAVSDTCLTSPGAILIVSAASWPVQCMLVTEKSWDTVEGADGRDAAGRVAVRTTAATLAVMVLLGTLVREGD